jgi:AcrR family transcriptional regulator
MRIQKPPSQIDEGRNAWLKVARDHLIRYGISSVKVKRLAKARRVTRGGFYWHFRNLDDLLLTLLTDWEINNSRAVLAALQSAGSPTERFARLIDVWIEEKDFNPDYDTAVREWALTSKAVRAAVQRVDYQRIDAIKNVMLAAGYNEAEASIRARVAYYHQVGYYAMRERETAEVRRRNAHLYVKILTGLPD